MRTILLFLIGIAALPFIGFTQTAADTSVMLPSGIGLIARSDGKSVTLRWGPKSPVAWELANQYGYILERADLGKDSLRGKPMFERLSPGPLKPWSLEDMKLRLQRDNEYAAIAAQMLYGNFSTTGDFSDLRFLKNEAAVQNNRHGFALFAADMSPEVADALALRWVDAPVNPDHVYLYRVYTLIAPEQYRMDTAYYVIKPAETFSLPTLPRAKATGLEKAVELSWDLSRVNNYFSAYFVERADKKQVNWHQLNTSPLVLTGQDDSPLSRTNLSFTDSLPGNYTPFLYRLVGVTPFGDASLPGAPVEAFGQDRTPPAAITDIQATGIADNVIRISWKKEVQDADLKGFFVERAPQVQGAFSPLITQALPPGTTEFLDKTADFTGQNYYRVIAVDTADNAAVSPTAYAVLVDTVAPAAPEGLIGQIDTNGIIRLWWNLGAEFDISGYRVFMANQPDHEFANRTPYLLADTMFVDSTALRTLTKYIYYKVCAVDGHFNHSEFSQILKLKRPDIIPPVMPLIRDITVSDSSVQIFWIPSSSNDVTEHILFRRQDQGEWQEIARFPMSDQSATVFTDKMVQPKTHYLYSLEAIDEAGLRSGRCHPADALVYDSGRRKPIEQFRVAYDPNGKMVRLNWKYDISDQFYFVVYRSFKQSPFTSYRSVDGTSLDFNDRNLVGDGMYTYAVKAMYRDGGQSPFSEKLSVDVK